MPDFSIRLQPATMTYFNLFPSLPDPARCWIYVAPRRLTEAEQATLLETLQTFFAGWASHGRPVQGAAAFLDDHFLAVAGAIAGGEISGCGIDASVHATEEAAGRLGVAWSSPLLVLYRDADGAVRSLPRSAFRKLVDDGTVTAETPVFDVSLTTLGQLRSGAFEKPAGASWHARVFRIPEPAA